jgi:hypothetical protein
LHRVQKVSAQPGLPRTGQKSWWLVKAPSGSLVQRGANSKFALFFRRAPEQVDMLVGTLQVQEGIDRQIHRGGADCIIRRLGNRSPREHPLPYCDQPPIF